CLHEMVGPLELPVIRRVDNPQALAPCCGILGLVAASAIGIEIHGPEVHVVDAAGGIRKHVGYSRESRSGPAGEDHLVAGGDVIVADAVPTGRVAAGAAVRLAHALARSPAADIRPVGP